MSNPEINVSAMRNRCAIGIDPGSSMGIAVISGGKIELVETLYVRCGDVMPQLVLFVALYRHRKPLVAVEVPGRFMYARNSGKSAPWQISMGQVLERARAIANRMREEGHEVAEVMPKKSWTKWPADYFQRFFDCKLKTNEHERDAACHAWRALTRTTNSKDGAK